MNERTQRLEGEPQSANNTLFEKIFHLRAHGTNVRTEVIAGATTFFTMCYTLLVTSGLMSQAGMDKGAVFVATCLVAIVGCLLMAFLANYPIAVAPGVGLLGYFAFSVIIGSGVPWQTALGAVFISGVLYAVISLFKLRDWIIESIPDSLRIGLSGGIGLFLAFIALRNSGILVANQATLVSLGNVVSLHSLLALLGFFLVIAFESRRIKGGVLLSIIIITIIGLVMGDINYHGIVSLPPSLSPTFMQLDLMGALQPDMISIILTLLLIAIFNDVGTLLAIGDTYPDMKTKQGKMPRIGRALFSSGATSVFASFFGTPTAAVYAENFAGVSAGGRTGLTAFTIAILFALALLFSPVAEMVPNYATAGALLFIAVLMMGGLARVDWLDLTEAAPAVVTTAMIPLSSSISDGLGLGFISYVVIKVVSGRFRQIPIGCWVLAIVFLLKFIFLH
ncbi:NCS2 family permease [Dongshaea marina]|uniref:NCS2 family permease n=1 Tax=Dongshaea marina TaxID=2047966 RepID=UPI001F390D28|nr:NCS2 family permease [Dongshaea marina]